MRLPALQDPLRLCRRVRFAPLLLVALLAPTAGAAVPFVLELTDARGDVRQLSGEPLNVPSADIVAFRSTHANGTIRHEVEMAAPPTPPYDSMLIVTWFRDSENGSFWTVEIEVRGDAVQPEDRLRAVTRRETEANATPIDVKYGVRNATWIFSFNESVVEDATCFDPGAFSTWERNRISGGDAAYDRARHCRQAPSTQRPPPPPAIVIRNEEPQPATPAPGSEATPALGALALVGALAFVALTRRARR